MRIILSVFIRLALLAAIAVACPASAEIVFETDFSEHPNGWSPLPGTSNVTQSVGAPAPWDGYKWASEGTGSSLGIIPGAGRDGTPALRVGYSWGSRWGSRAGAMSLMKHLGAGYDELYIRFTMKYDDDWKWGDGRLYAFQKLFRLWQNVDPNDRQWSELTPPLDKRWIIFTQSSSETAGVRHPFWNLTASANTNQTSSNGAAVISAWYPSPWWRLQSDLALNLAPYRESGHLEPHFGTIDPATGAFVGRPTQRYHAVEVHIKLADPRRPDGTYPDNGVFEVWVDGTKQIRPNRVTHVYGADLINTWTNMPTEKYGVGINAIVFLDNMYDVSTYWDAPRYFWVDDVVISTQPIGQDYVLGRALQPLRGDVDGDGRLTLRDAIQLLRWIAGQPGRPAQGTPLFLAADVNRDGRLTLADFICLLRGIMAGGTLPC